MNTLKKINELTLSELQDKYELDYFDAEEYTLDGLNHETVIICGYAYGEGDVLKELDPTAFHQTVLDFTDNLLQDEAIEETKDGRYVWVQDIDLDDIGLQLNY